MNNLKSQSTTKQSHKSLHNFTCNKYTTKKRFCKWWLIKGESGQTFVALFISASFEATSSVLILREVRSLLSSIRQQLLCMALTLSHNFAISVLKWLIWNKNKQREIWHDNHLMNQFFYQWVTPFHITQHITQCLSVGANCLSDRWSVIFGVSVCWSGCVSV